MGEPHKSIDHSLWEDAQAFVLGTMMCALGLQLLTEPGLITGQTAGLAVLLSYISGWSLGVVFFIVNIPFWALAYVRMGPRFTVKSGIAVGMLSIMTEVFPRVIEFNVVFPAAGAFLAGGAIGLGLVVLFRHGASLGGIGVLALLLQEKIGIRAGWTQLAFDAALFGIAMFFLPMTLVAWSLLGAVVVNLIVGVNHRGDRYVAR